MCTRPRYINAVDRYGKKVVRVVPCGKCPDCLRAYQNGIKLRAYYQWLQYPKAVFFTLTYDREHMPILFDRFTGEVFQDEFCDTSLLGVRRNRNYIGIVSVSDVQKWLKRGRRKYFYHNPNAGKITYFITSEYGPKSLRPHVHGIMYNISIDDFDTYFLSSWGLGNVDRSALRLDDKHSPMKVTNYVSKYCSKGMFESPRVARGYVTKTFHLVSNGFGLYALPELKARILRDLPTNVYVKDNHEFSGLLSFKERREDSILDLFGKMGDKDHLFDKSEVKTDFLPNTYIKRRSMCPGGFNVNVCPFYHKYRRNSIVVKGDKCVYFPPTKEVLEHICNNLSLSFYDKDKKQTFTYALPRYYKVYLFGQGTPLSKEISAYVSQRVSNRLDQDAKKLFAANRDTKGYSLETAYKGVFAYLVEDALSKERDFETQFAQFLSKSRF